MVSNKITIVAGAAKVKIFGPATKDQTIILTTDGSGILIGGANLTDANGFQMNQATLTIQLKALDEIWAVTTSTTVISYLTS